MKKHISLTLILVVSVVLAACSSPTPAPAPTADATEIDAIVNATLTAVAPAATPTSLPTQVVIPTVEATVPPPTPTILPPTPTLAPVQGDPVTFLGKPSGTDDFTNANNWTTYDNTCFSNQVTGGQFVMTANGLKGVICWTVSWPLIQNFYIETTMVMPTTCDPNDRFGLLFRAPDNTQGYLYGYTCSGQYSLSYWNGSQSVVLIKSTSSTAILTGPGAINRMGLQAFGSTYDLYANGQFLAEAQDSTYLDAGKIGYFVQAATDQPFTVEYNNLTVWQLSDQFYPAQAPAPALPPAQVSPPASNTPTGTATSNLNVRSGPSTLYPVIGVVPKGTTGEIVGVSQDSAWYAVKVPTSYSGNGIGWVSAGYVTLSNPTNQALPVIAPPAPPPPVNLPPPATGVPQVTFTQAAVIRQGPTIEYPVYGVAQTGTKAEVAGVSQDGQWWAIKVSTAVASNGLGWVYKAYTTAQNTQNVKVVQPPPLPTNITPAVPGSNAPAAITIEPINIRSGPGNAYPSLGKVPAGTVMAVVGKSADGEFIVVNLPKNVSPSGQGWLPTRYVTLQNADNLPVIQPPPVP
jgi:uncharacterized protein YraI